MRSLVTALLAVTWASAGPIVTVTSSGTTLANTLLGSGITLSGTPTLTEARPQSGTFTGGPSLVGFSSGIILSTGDASSASGNYGGPDLPSTDEGGAGNAGLSSVIGGATTYDAAVLQFNFVPNASTVTFRYTFASAEYPDFINTKYDDAFAFFVNGTNYALVPGTSTPVSINTINALTNAMYFKKYNAAGDQLPYGGETVVLTFTAPVNAGIVNTIELGIADAGDAKLDSAVFIQAGSFKTEFQPFVSVPEPATFGVLGVGFLGLALARSLRGRRRNRASNGERIALPPRTT